MTRQYERRSNQSHRESADSRILQRTGVRSIPVTTSQVNTEPEADDKPRLKQDFTQIPVCNYDRMATRELPDCLKVGIEKLSGMPMDDVKVHYNSSKPSELQALAYTQGTDIHVGPGQEKYLPHEAWHVVQQKQRRVKPTNQMKGRINVNEDPGLENEADRMGTKALNYKYNQRLKNKTEQNHAGKLIIVQKMMNSEGNDRVETGSATAQDRDLQEDYQKIYQVAEQNADKLNGTTLEYIKSTLIALQIIDNNAEEIRKAEKPRNLAMELTNIGIEDGFNTGESAEHIRANARMIVTYFPKTDSIEAQIQYINQTLKRGDPCLTARMEMIQNHVAKKIVGDIEVEGEPDSQIAMKIYTLWNEVEETGIDWAAFIQTIPAEIKDNPAFVASLRYAKEAASV